MYLKENNTHVITMDLDVIQHMLLDLMVVSHVVIVIDSEIALKRVVNMEETVSILNCIAINWRHTLDGLTAANIKSSRDGNPVEVII